MTLKFRKIKNIYKNIYKYLMSMSYLHYFSVLDSSRNCYLHYFRPNNELQHCHITKSHYLRFTGFEPGTPRTGVLHSTNNLGRTPVNIDCNGEIIIAKFQLHKSIKAAVYPCRASDMQGFCITSLTLLILKVE
jgi:hypothetical protein